jgi:hypothetical protein
MAKSVLTFDGIDSYCRHITVAYREDGVAFWRTFAYNGFGLAPTKWAKLKDCVSLQDALESLTIEWGFKTLDNTGKGSSYRLPNA